MNAIIDLKNGLTKFLYHETSMIVTIANAIFEGDLNIKNFYNCKKLENTITNNHLSFYRVNKKNFPIIDLKSRLTEMPSTPIIINAANELLVEEYLKRKLPFLSINKYIFDIMHDINYKKYAIKTPKNIKQIYEIDTWAKSVIREKI